MIGTNKLELNQATMCAAVQEYLVARMPTTPIRVSRVEPAKDGTQGYSTSDSFRVTIEEPAAEPDPR